MTRISVLIHLLLFTWVYQACSQPPMLPQPSVDLNQYPWLRPEFNAVQFYNRSALEHFHKAWKNTKNKKVSIVHFGDSHLQGDVYPGQLRKRLHALHGDGGRGLMFAFSTARTYSSIEYSTSHTGTWQAERAFTMLPKLPMGVRGMTCRTESLPASLSFSFAEEVPSHYDRLRIYCKKTDASFDLIVRVNNQEIPVTIDGSTADIPYVSVKIPAITDKKLSLQVVRGDNGESEFEYYGMSLETSEDRGIVVHNAGVGAARSHAILYKKLFKEQLPHFEPDLVIIDYGTNDYLYDDYIRPELEKEIRKVIATVREAAPKTSIILTSAQDLYFKRRNCRSGEAFSDMIHRIAKETNCGVYDWYWVSGAQGTMLKWVEAGLAQPDMIHLGVSGYRLKGNLLADALKYTMERMEENSDETAFLLPVSDSLREEQARIRARIPQRVPTAVATQYAAKPGAKPTNAARTGHNAYNSNSYSTAGRVKYLHKIVKGESLYTIANKYKVTVSQLMAWNGLRNHLIHAGKVLLVYVKK